jgi:hypothetical protein
LSLISARTEIEYENAGNENEELAQMEEILK